MCCDFAGQTRAGKVSGKSLMVSRGSENVFVLFRWFRGQVLADQTGRVLAGGISNCLVVVPELYEQVWIAYNPTSMVMSR